MSFTRIYYDAYKNHLYCVETIEGKRSKIDFHPKFEYYIPDNTGESPYRDIYGNTVKLQESETRQGMKSVAEAVKTCESDLSEDIKFLQKRYGGQKLKVDLGNFQIATIDIEVESEKEFPKPDLAKYPINLISVHYSKEDQIYTWGLRPYTGNDSNVKNYTYCADEPTLIRSFIAHFRKKQVDILTGWNVMGFDVPYFVNRSKRLKIEETLSPLNVYKERKHGGYHIEGGGYIIAGLSILDGLELYKNFVYVKRERYSLQFIGMLEVGEGKKDLEGTVNTAWKTDWNSFVEYNVQDVNLTRKIEEKKKHIKLTIDFCYQALIPFDRIFSSITLVTGYMLRRLHEKNIVFPDRINAEKNHKFPGAYVMAKPGYYNWVVSFDVASMYPHMISQYNISPETLCHKEYTLIYNGKDYFFDGNDEILVESENGYIKKFVKDLLENDVIHINTSKEDTLL